MPRSYQVTPKVLGRRRATQAWPVRPGRRHRRLESARRQPENQPQRPDVTAQTRATLPVTGVSACAHPSSIPAVSLAPARVAAECSARFGSSGLDLRSCASSIASESAGGGRVPCCISMRLAPRAFSVLVWRGRRWSQASDWTSRRWAAGLRPWRIVRLELPVGLLIAASSSPHDAARSAAGLAMRVTGTRPVS